MTHELEQRIDEIETKMPGIKSELKPYRGATWGLHWTGSVKDVAYLEAENYQIAAAKWEEHNWSQDGGGIEWKEWVAVSYRLKGTENLQTFKLREIITRDKHDPRRDRQDLWEYDFVSLEHLGGTEIKVAWRNKDGCRAYGTDQVVDLAEVEGRR